jgi:hypothetical protein
VESQAKRDLDRANDNECELSDIDMPARTHDMKSVHTPHGQRAHARARDAKYRPGLHYRQIDQNAYRSSRGCTEPFLYRTALSNGQDPTRTAHIP